MSVSGSLETIQKSFRFPADALKCDILFHISRFADQATCVAHQDAIESCLASLEGNLMTDDNFAFSDANIWNDCFKDENGNLLATITW